MYTNNAIDPSRDPRRRKMSESGTRAPPAPVRTGNGPTRTSERELAYDVNYELGAGMIMNGPEPPAVQKPPPPPAESMLVHIDQLVCLNHREEQGFLLWNRGQDAWVSECDEYGKKVCIVFAAATFIHIAVALASGRFVFLSEDEPSSADFMVRLRSKDRGDILKFRSVVDSRHKAARRTDIDEPSMDQLIKKLELVFEQHLVAHPHSDAESAGDQMVTDSPSEEFPVSNTESRGAGEQMIVDSLLNELSDAEGAESQSENLPHPQSHNKNFLLPTTEQVLSPQAGIFTSASPEIALGPSTILESTAAPSTQGSDSAGPSQSPHSRGIPLTIRQSPAPSSSANHSVKNKSPPSASPTPRRSQSPSDSQTSEIEDMEPVNEGDLVIRMRRKSKNDDPKLRLDSFDIWDGPWRVEKFACAAAEAKASASKSDKTRSAQAVNVPVTAKLLFPDGSKAKAWTEIKDLRKAFELPPGSSPVEELRSASAQRKLYASAVAFSKSSDRQPNTSPLFITKLANGAFVSFPHVSAKGMGESLYEVGHLRAKKVVLRDANKFDDEVVEDTETLNWLKEKRKLRKGTVPVVEYLVHWAGWPSEDDTWERAYNNISSESIKAFEGARDQATIFPNAKK